MVEKQKRLDLLKLEYCAGDIKINHCLVNNSYPTEVFIKALSHDEKISLIALFKLFGNKQGRLSNTTKFKKLEHYHVAIFEFKDYQVRLAGFWRPDFNFNLIYGFKKKRDSWPKTDLKAMKQNYDNFITEEKIRNQEKTK